MSKVLKIVPVMWFMLLVNYMERTAMSFSGPSIMKELSITPSQFGVILSSFSFGYLLAQIPGGILADRFGAKLLLVVSPVLWALFTGVVGLVSVVDSFIVVRVCLGLSEGIFNTSYYKLVGDNFEKKKTSQILAICSTATVLAPACVGGLVHSLAGDIGWRGMFFLLSIPALIAALSVFIIVPSKSSAAAVQHVEQADKYKFVVRVWRMPSVWLLSAAFFAFNIAYWGYIGWMPSYLAMSRHIDLKAIGGLGAVPYVFGFLGMLICGVLGSAWLSRYRPFLTCVLCLGAGLSMLIACEADTLRICLAGLSGAAFCMFGVVGPLGAIALDLAPAESRAVYVGTYNTIGQLGSVVAPAVIGSLAQSSGSFVAGFTLMAVALCATGFGIMMVIPIRNGKREVGVPAEQGHGNLRYKI